MSITINGVSLLELLKGLEDARVLVQNSNLYKDSQVVNDIYKNIDDTYKYSTLKDIENNSNIILSPLDIKNKK